MVQTEDIPNRSQYALSVRNVTKEFPGTIALDGVSLDVSAGTVHCLLGGNGSGKSTLIKLLAGVQRADSGDVTVHGRSISANRTTPTWSRQVGLRFVHQDVALFPALTVAENMAMGQKFPVTRFGMIQKRILRQRSSEVLANLGITIASETLVADLAPAQRSLVAIARALQDSTDVLVLDEPTASLPAREVQMLLDMIRRLTANGSTVLLVTQRLDEALKVADHITVLRDGRVAASTDSQISERELVELMVGRRSSRGHDGSPTVPVDTEAETVLDVRNVSGGPLVDVSFQLQMGEILGVAGLLGSGRSTLMKMLFGALPYRSGSMRLKGREVHFKDTTQARDAGIAFVPEDRSSEATFPEMSVRENLSAASVGEYWRKWRLRHRREAGDAKHAIKEFFIKAHSHQQPLVTLSGGNQQKVVLARWLRRSPSVLLLDEPSQGVDAATRAELHSLIRKTVGSGAAAVVVSSDFEELASLVDRVLILQEGRVVDELRRPDIEPLRLIERVLQPHAGSEGNGES